MTLLYMIAYRNSQLPPICLFPEAPSQCSLTANFDCNRSFELIEYWQESNILCSMLSDFSQDAYFFGLSQKG